jgi:Cu/Zn superoxide dismutase
MGLTSKSKLLSAALIAGAAIAVTVGYAPVAAQSEQGGATYRATLTALNGGGASGQAVLTKQGQSLRVQITATGLEAGGVHLSHVHGLSEGDRSVNSTCPTQAQDTDRDGFLELAEGVPVYGPILVDFMNIDPDQDGNVNFTTTVPLTDATMPLQMRHIVIHGMSVGPVGAGTPGEVNGEAGYKTVLPVLCGEIRNAPNSNAMKFRKVN